MLFAYTLELGWPCFGLFVVAMVVYLVGLIFGPAINPFDIDEGDE